MSKLLFNLNIALDAILTNKLRSILTALGIIFGVAAVIAMMAIGNGAKQEILDQIELVGVNNIVVTPIWKADDYVATEDDGPGESKRFSEGLVLEDAQSIAAHIPTVDVVSPEVIIEADIMREGRMSRGKVIGVENSFFSLNGFSIGQGSFFNRNHLEKGDQVCIIGYEVAKQYFIETNPIGEKIKCGKTWLTVIGILDARIISESAIENLGIRNYNMDVYIPIKTALLRFKNRALVTSTLIKRESENDEEEAEEQQNVNYHQLDKLVIQVSETEFLEATSEIVSRMLTRRHNGEVDFEISIPELLLKQQQKAKNVFNIVLFAIAFISLLVGGIGIMNIMLASVLERIKEIGLRMSIGAGKRDIVAQFLLEAILISLTGGIAGVILGVAISKTITAVTGILTIVGAGSILLSFLISVSVGVIFGIIPARRAAQQDPIKSLRHE